jgi:hypothetical protein
VDCGANKTISWDHENGYRARQLIPVLPNRQSRLEFPTGFGSSERIAVVSSLQPPMAAALVANDGTRYPAAGISLVSGPHVLYNPPPSIGLGIGGFGVSGCCSGFGSGIGIGVPVGGPTIAEASDQYVASVLIPLPPDYASNWSGYRVEVLVGAQPMSLAAPAPAG